MTRKGRHSARELARRALRRVESQSTFATAAIDAELDESPTDTRERALTTELVYGTLRHRERLDEALSARAPRGIKKLAPQMRTILRVAAYQLMFLDRVPDHAVVDDAVRAARKLGGNKMAGFANAVLRALAREGAPPVPAAKDDLIAHVRVMYSLPEWLIARLRAAVGEAELVDAAAALAESAPLVIRVNRLRATRDAVAARLAADHPDASIQVPADVPAAAHCPEALIIRGLGDPERSPSFAEGLWTVQDLGAQRVGYLLRPQPGQRVLDACAGLGGKSAHLAELADDRATIVAVDVSRKKLALADATAARLGLRGIETRAADLLEPDALAGETFEAVLLDAPCSGLGVLRRHPEAKWRVAEELIAQMAMVQRRLLDTVAGRVQPGGALVYSVCTFTEDEGPAQIEAFLQRSRDFERDGEDLHTWPHRDGADAFYAARLVRAAC
ncbi:MAG TPA: 16S rRNA (cytosine(967)-C(5))-methyltransferase RsmB [Kofleriaceae bacterium]|nr:16S rRNA (cytosine(967)-C(5))-methyltransferase RsmB [Kofleriaceae bacterium]